MRNKFLVSVSALAIATIAIAPMFLPHSSGAQTLPEPAIQQQQWPQTYTFTGATPAPYVIPVTGYNWCTGTASTGATFNGTTLTAKDSNDKGTTYLGVSGSSDLGATPAPSQTFTAAGTKLSFPVRSHNLFEIVASGGGSSTSIPFYVSCSL